MSRARRGGALRALVVGSLIAFVVAYGGCLAYEATLRTDLEELRAELEAEGAVLDLGDFADTLERGDPRTADFLRTDPQLPRADDEARAAFEARVAALGPLDVRGGLEQTLARVERGEAVFVELDLPLQSYIGLSEAAAGELLELAMAGEAAGYGERVALAVRVVELLDGDGTLLGFIGRSTAEFRLLEKVEAALGLLPAGVDLSSLHAHLAGLEPRARLERAFEGERAYGLDMLARSAPEVAPGLAFGGQLQRLQLERDYFAGMAECLELLDLSWKELQLEQPRRLERTSLSSPHGYLPRIENHVSSALELQARRDLALAALAARDGGQAAALAFLAERTDPFTGAPYAAEVGSDGFLRLASAGPDTVLVPGEWSATREEGVDDPRWLIAPEADGE